MAGPIMTLLTTIWNTLRNRTPVRLGCWIAAGLLWLCPPALVIADTVTLNSGEVLEGRIVSETDDQLMMEVALFSGTILTRREVAKADVKSIARESLAEKQEKAAYTALTKNALNPDQELGKDEYAAGIAAFQSFLAKYPNSSHADDVNKSIADWSAEASNIASGKVKFAGQWMSPEMKIAHAEQARQRAESESARNTLPTLKAHLADLQAQRAAAAASVTVVQAKLAAAQAKHAALPDTRSSGTTAVGADRGGLAGQLTQQIKVPNQTEPDTAAGPSPEQVQVHKEIALYEQQVSQGQSSISALDTKIQELQTQIPKLEETVKLAPPERAPEPPPAAKTNSASVARQTATQPAKPTKAEPPPPDPWYKRALNWFHK